MKQFASSTLPTLEKHLKRAQELEQIVGAPRVRWRDEPRNQPCFPARLPAAGRRRRPRLARGRGAAAAQRVPEPPGRKLGWAIVGLGSLAINQILPAFAKCENSKVTALVSGSPGEGESSRSGTASPEKNIYNYENYDTIKDNPDIDVVYVVLPNSMHAEYTIRAAQAGKHVLCEKPMANTAADCQQMIDASRQAQRKLMVAYRLRYEPYNQA